MSEDLYRITVDEPNYSNVLESPIKPEEERVELPGIEDDEEVRLWAIRPGSNNEKLYEELEPGDGLLFYLTDNSQGSGGSDYVAVGRVGRKVRANEEDAKKLFRTSVATRMYTVENFQKVPLSKEQTEGILGYSSYPQGPHRVTDERYDTVQSFFEKVTSSETRESNVSDSSSTGRMPGVDVYIEKTKLHGDYKRRDSGVHEEFSLGNSIYSPQRDAGGGKRYEQLREASIGDVVVHILQDERKILGVSTVSSELVTDKTFPEGVEDRWEEQQQEQGGYFRSLSNYEELDEPIDVYDDLLNAPEHQDRLEKIRRGNKGVFYDRRHELAQGHYFTYCPEELVDLLSESSSELRYEMREHSLVQKMVEIYHDDIDWEQKKEHVENTSEAVWKLVRSIVNTKSRIGSDEMTAVYLLCSHPNSIGADAKEEKIRRLNIPEEDIESIVPHLERGTGTVFAGKMKIDVPEEYQKEAYRLFKTAVETDANREDINKAIEDFASLGVGGIQSGTISAVLYFLHPEEYPIINNPSINGMEVAFDKDVSQSLSDYLDEAEKYREVNKAYNFHDNFRDLDLFLYFAEDYKERARDALKDSPGGEIENGEPENDYWTWNSNYKRMGTDGSACFRRGIASTYGPKKYGEMLSKVNGGDMIIAYCDKGVGYRGIGRVTGETVPKPVDKSKDEVNAITESTNEYHIDVDWIYTLPKEDAITPQEGADILGANGPLQVSTLQKLDQEGSARLHEEIRQRYMELNEVDRRAEIETQLRDKKQVVFYGPPGTSKTYTATRLAQWWRAKEDRNAIGKKQVRNVTFHPSFSYEDFLEGFTSSVKNNQVEYDYEDGTFLKIVKDATEAYENAEEGEAPPFFLIIDEINRGNLAQIFGEIITLLEEDKRLDERNQMSTQLAHSGDEFSVPPNLYLIGTMNTADESIALIDAALRRRFRLIPFPPEMEKVTEYYDLDGEDLEQLANGGDGFEQLLSVSVLALNKINDRILSEPHLGRGKQIGHTYLLEVDSEEELVNRWRFEILPQLDNHYFGQFESLQDDLLPELDSGSNIIDTDNRRIAEFNRDGLYEDLREIANLPTKGTQGEDEELEI